MWQNTAMQRLIAIPKEETSGTKKSENQKAKDDAAATKALKRRVGTCGRKVTNSSRTE